MSSLCTRLQPGEWVHSACPFGVDTGVQQDTNMFLMSASHDKTFAYVGWFLEDEAVLEAIAVENTYYDNDINNLCH